MKQRKRSDGNKTYSQKIYIDKRSYFVIVYYESVMFYNTGPWSYLQMLDQAGQGQTLNFITIIRKLRAKSFIHWLQSVGEQETKVLKH